MTVSLGASHARAEADATEGKWSLQLPAEQVNAKGQELIVAEEKGGGDRIVFSDVLIGEVWLCSGKNERDGAVICALHA